MASASTALPSPTSETQAAPAPATPAHASSIIDDIIEVPGEAAGASSSNAAAAKKKAAAHTTANSDGTATAASADGVERIWVSVLTVTATTSDDTNTGLTRAKVEAFVAKLNDYWNTESEGAVTIELGGYETRSVNESECTPRDLFTSVPVDAFAGRFAKSAWKGTNDHLAMLSVEGCGRTGLGTIGGDGGIMFSGNGIGDSLGVPVLAHEFGHNLGFGHAGSSVCESTTNVDSARSDFGDDASRCPTDEYGDYLDIMGYSISGALPHLSSAQRIHNGYLSAYRSIEGYTGTTTVKVGRLGGTGSLRALKVIDPISGDAYYVEYGTAAGADATSTEFTRDTKCVTTDDGYANCSRSSSAATGAVRIIRELPYRSNADYVKTTVLAVSDPRSKKRTTHLDAGDSFTSADGGFTVHINSLNTSTGASISVRMGAANATSTSVAVNKSTQKYGSTARATATATVTSSTTGGPAPAGSVAFYSGSTHLATVALTAKSVASYRLPASLAAGKRAISARFVPTSIADAASVSKSRTVTVTRAASATSISLAKSKVSAKSRAKVTVKVSVSGATAAGKLYAYANGKKVASYTLPSAKKGSMTITLPKLKSSAAISVSYAGSSNIVGTKSAAKKLSVKR